jgi:hypothetical protein
LVESSSYATKKKKLEEDDQIENKFENKHQLSSSAMEDDDTNFLPSHLFISKNKQNPKLVKKSYLLIPENHQPLLQTPSSYSDINNTSISYDINNTYSSTFSIDHSLDSINGKSLHFFPLATNYGEEVFMSENLFEQQRKLRFRGDFSDSRQLMKKPKCCRPSFISSCDNETSTSSVYSSTSQNSNNQTLSSTATPNEFKLQNGLLIYNKCIIIL